MSSNDPTPNVSELTTTATCLGCGKEINLLEIHLALGHKNQRSVIEKVNPAVAGVETDEDGQVSELAVDVTDSDAVEEAESSEFYYVGVRSGAGEQGYCHNYGCASEYFNDLDDGEPLKVKFLRDEGVERSSE